MICGSALLSQIGLEEIKRRLDKAIREASLSEAKPEPGTLDAGATKTEQNDDLEG